MFVNKIRVHLAYLCAIGVLLQSNKPIAAEHQEVLQKLIDSGVPMIVRHLAAYEDATRTFMVLLTEVMLHSPFFVRKNDLDSSNAQDGRAVDVVVANTHEIVVAAQAGDTFTWEFTTKGMDIKFGATFEPAAAGSAKEAIYPLGLVNSHIAPVAGEFVLPADGSVRMLWDNTYSWLYNKELHVMTKLVPNPERIKRDLQGLLDQSRVSPPPAVSPLS